MMNELADRLDAWWMDSNPTPEREAIIKALRFAADMERLMQKHAQPWFEDCVDGQTELRVTIQHEVRYFYGDDIYTAACRAVEALETLNEG